MLRVLRCNLSSHKLYFSKIKENNNRICYIKIIIHKVTERARLELHVVEHQHCTLSPHQLDTCALWPAHAPPVPLLPVEPPASCERQRHGNPRSSCSAPSLCAPMPPRAPASPVPCIPHLQRLQPREEKLVLPDVDADDQDVGCNRGKKKLACVRACAEGGRGKNRRKHQTRTLCPHDPTSCVSSQSPASLPSHHIPNQMRGFRSAQRVGEIAKNRTSQPHPFPCTQPSPH